jgi:hypothetical protein
MRGQEKLSTWDFFYALDMAIACLISYSIITYVLAPVVVTPDALRDGLINQRLTRKFRAARRSVS